MGIEGFWSYIYKSGLHDLFMEQVTCQGATLLVDGSNFMFHLMKLTVENGDQPIDRRFGGSYAEFRAIIRREVNQLLDLGFSITVFFDGHASAFKKKVLPASQGNAGVTGWKKEWADLHHIINYEVKVIDQDSLPLAPLTRHFFELVLRQDFGDTVQLVTCDREADIVIGQRCMQLIASGKKSCFIYSDDSDFAFMRGCALVKLGAFSQTEPATTTAASTVRFVEVWRRRTLSSILGLKESQLVDLAILVGCDFSRAELGDRSDLGLVAADGQVTDYAFQLDPPLTGSPAFAALLARMHQANSEQRVGARPANATLRLAIQYCRAFYEVNVQQADHIEGQLGTLLAANAAELIDADLVHDPLELVDAPGAAGADAEDEGEEEAPDYEVTARAAARDFVRGLLQTGSSDLLAIAWQILQYLTEHAARAAAETASTTEGAVPADQEDTGFWPDSEHCHCLARMLTDLNVSEPSMEGMTHTPDPRWEDVSAAKAYEDLLYFALRRLYPLPLTAASAAQIGQLERLFDGRRFHIYLGYLRNAAVPAVAPDQKDSESEADLEDLLAQAIGDATLEDAAPEDLAQELPINQEPKRSEILAAIRDHSVVVINGETGCGKSTRLPLMLVDEARDCGERCKVLVSEPHRLAAQKLYDRIHSLRPDEVCCRMGRTAPQGPADAPITYATAGYIFHRFVGHMDDLLEYTHIILDEVHERSVENDLVFLIVKHLLEHHPHLKVVLMSATPPDLTVFTKYFTAPGGLAHVHIETRTFGITHWFIEDLRDARADAAFQGIFTRDINFARTQLINYCSNAVNGAEAIPGRLFKKQTDIAVPLILTCEVGTGVLVFVSGLAEIDALTIRLSKYKHLKIVSIHSDLADERNALREEFPDHIRVILATNAAESSLTLPDVNVVICLGTCNLEQYDSTQFARTVLRNSWISQPSAAQRAGRTGRVRDGTVYHLYTRALHDQVFPQRNPPAIVCKPLHDVVVRVLGCLGGGYFNFLSVAHLLAGMIEPPALEHLQDSLEYLHEGNMVSTSNPDDCALTALGEFASLLPTSTHLSRMIHTGILLGIGPYAVILSVILGRQHTQPFRARPATQTHPDDFNDLTRKVFLFSAQTDRGTHSEPIMLLKLFCIWRSAGKGYKRTMTERLNWKRIRFLVKEVELATSRVNDALAHFRSAPVDMSDLHVGGVQANVDLLRLLLVWSAGGNVLKCRPAEPAYRRTQPETAGFLLRNSQVTPEKVAELFPADFENGMRVGADLLARKLHTFECKTFPALSKTGVASLLTELLGRDESLDAAWVWYITATGPKFTLATTNLRTAADLAVIFARLAPEVAATELFQEVQCRGVSVLLCSCAASLVAGKQIDSALLMLYRRSLEVYFVPRAAGAQGVRMLVKSCDAGCEGLLRALREVFGNTTAAFAVESVVTLPHFQRVEFVDSSRPGRSHWADIPLGMRLLGAYGARRRSRMLEVGSFDADPDREQHDWNEVATARSLHVRGNPAQWELLKGTSVNGSPLADLAKGTFVRAAIDSYSYVQPSSPQSRTGAPVYAVANTVIESVRGEVTRITCDQVTIIPHSEEWLVAALRCVDKAFDGMTCDGAELLCTSIRQRLHAHARSPSVSLDANLVNALQRMHAHTAAVRHGGGNAPAPRAGVYQPPITPIREIPEQPTPAGEQPYRFPGYNAPAPHREDFNIPQTEERWQRAAPVPAVAPAPRAGVYRPPTRLSPEQPARGGEQPYRYPGYTPQPRNGGYIRDSRQQQREPTEQRAPYAANGGRGVERRDACRDSEGASYWRNGGGK